MTNLELFYLGPIDLQKDKEIKSFIQNLFTEGDFNITPEWNYQESTYRQDIQVRWIGWDLPRSLTQDERYRVVLSITSFFPGVNVSEIS